MLLADADSILAHKPTWCGPYYDPDAPTAATGLIDTRADNGNPFHNLVPFPYVYCLSRCELVGRLQVRAG